MNFFRSIESFIIRHWPLCSKRKYGTHQCCMRMLGHNLLLWKEDASEHKSMLVSWTPLRRWKI